jgi:hypothetical protein
MQEFYLTARFKNTYIKKSTKALGLHLKLRTDRVKEEMYD